MLETPGQLRKSFTARMVRLLVAVTVGSEKHDAVAGPAGVIAKAPMTTPIESDDRLDPTATIEVGPLVGEPQMRLDDLGPNSLKVHAARITPEVAAQPIATIALDLETLFPQNHPMIEHTLLERLAGGVAPPDRFSVDYGGIGAHVLPFEQRHPHIPGLDIGFVLLAACQ